MIITLHFVRTDLDSSALFQVLHLLREAGKHGAKEHDVFIFSLQLFLQLEDVVVGATQKALQPLKFALFQVLSQLLFGAFKCTAAKIKLHAYGHWEGETPKIAF